MYIQVDITEWQELTIVDFVHDSKFDGRSIDGPRGKIRDSLHHMHFSVVPEANGEAPKVTADPAMQTAACKLGLEGRSNSYRLERPRSISPDQ